MPLTLAIVALAASTFVTTSDLLNALHRNETNSTFSFRVKINALWPNYVNFSVEDGTGPVILHKSGITSEMDLRPGDVIEAIGYVKPRHYSFAEAVCTNAHVVSRGEAPQPEAVSIARFCEGRADARYVRISGMVRDAFRDERDPNWVYLSLSDGSDTIYVAFQPSSRGEDFRHLVGCEITATGICNPNEGGARHHAGRVLIMESELGFRILRTPVWWTPSKFLIVIGALLAVLVAVLAWNASLRLIAERRSRELLREKVARVSANLRVDERTRLAVELHDSVAQNLTGVALQIKAALRLAPSDPVQMCHGLEMAAKTLQSCRTELRNCLWDLRNQALDEPDMNKAIEQTIRPHLAGAELLIRFNVPRSKLSDNTAHAVLRIVRELVSNAIVHGYASQIRIAGGMEGKMLKFSVRDNGCGFDPDSVPGSSQGHFGLQGIRERIRRLAGDLRIDSAPGRGTRISITLP